MQRQAWLFAGIWRGTLTAVGLCSVLHTTAMHLFWWSDNPVGSYPHHSMLFNLYHVLKCLCYDTALSVPPLSSNSKHDEKSSSSFLSCYFDSESAENLAPGSRSSSSPCLLYFTHNFPLEKCYHQEQPARQDVVKLCWNRVRGEPAELWFWYLWCFDLMF